MGSPTSLLGNARAFARDYPRDQMPPGFLWDVADFMPAVIDAGLTGRPGWQWGSANIASGGGAEVETGILATFKTGDQLLVQNAQSKVFRITAAVTTELGATHRAIQNPVQLGEDVIHFDGVSAGGSIPQLWRTGGPVPAYGGMSKARVGTVWKASLITGGAPGEEDVIRYSVPGTDLTTAASYDVNAFDRTSQRVTGLQAMRTMVLIFHPGSVERLRGSILPNTAAEEEGDLIIEGLFDRIGCKDPKTIATWNDNAIFADEHGVHLTDGSVVRNLAAQGGILTLWRSLYAPGMVATVFGDYYMIYTVPSVDEATFLVCDLNRRQWFRFTNVQPTALISSSGSTGQERVWGTGFGGGGFSRMTRLDYCFARQDPPTGAAVIDANNVSVRPYFETPWYRLGEEGRKRIRFAYLSYDVQPPGFTPEGPALDLRYMTSPQADAFTPGGTLPTRPAGYHRYRLRLGRVPYGVAFSLRQTAPSAVTRIFDLSVEAQPIERSRV